MKNIEHVGRFAALFTVQTNRRGNKQLMLPKNVKQSEISDFIAGQVARPGDGPEKTVDAEILGILVKCFNSKVDDLDPVENSDALLKRVNGWNKRPEKAATSEENKANKSQVDEQNKLAAELAEAQAAHGEDSDEAKAAEKALTAYALSKIGQ